MQPESYLPNGVTANFHLFSTSSKEIEEEIGNLKTAKANGPYSLPTKILKLLQVIISKPLELIFKLSFSTGVVPYHFNTLN